MGARPHLHVQQGEDPDLVSQHSLRPVVVHSSDYSQDFILESPRVGKAQGHAQNGYKNRTKRAVSVTAAKERLYAMTHSEIGVKTVPPTSSPRISLPLPY